jgi:hypothetical protein
MSNINDKPKSIFTLGNLLTGLLPAGLFILYLFNTKKSYSITGKPVIAFAMGKTAVTIK